MWCFSFKMIMIIDFKAYLDIWERHKVKRRRLINQETKLAEIEMINSEEDFLNGVFEIEKYDQNWTWKKPFPFIRKLFAMQVATISYTFSHAESTGGLKMNDSGGDRRPALLSARSRESTNELAVNSISQWYPAQGRETILKLTNSF